MGHFLCFVVWRLYPGTVDVCVAVTVAWVMIVKLAPCVTVAVSERFVIKRSCFSKKKRESFHYIPISLRAGLRRSVTGVRGQKSLDTGEAQVRFPGPT